MAVSEISVPASVALVLWAFGSTVYHGGTMDLKMMVVRSKERDRKWLVS